MTQSRMDTRPDESEVTLPALGPVGMLRWAWRQLTSMRTALFLLLLLAIAAVPGSIWPQRNIDASRVADYLVRHGSTGPWLDRLGFFDVYSSPWFAAIYLLLFVSLVGCVVPRSKIHWRAMRAQPPRVPQNLERLPAHGQIEVAGAPEDVLQVARDVLARKQPVGGRSFFRLSVGKRYRIRRDGLSLSAESGYLRESGNLVFHTALIVVIVAVAVGHLFGWRGDRILVTGKSFSNTTSAYDTFDPGPWVDTEGLSPFSVAVDKLDVTFEERSSAALRAAAALLESHVEFVDRDAEGRQPCGVHPGTGVEGVVGGGGVGEALAGDQDAVATPSEQVPHRHRDDDHDQRGMEDEVAALAQVTALSAQRQTVPANPIALAH